MKLLAAIVSTKGKTPDQAAREFMAAVARFQAAQQEPPAARRAGADRTPE